MNELSDLSSWYLPFIYGVSLGLSTAFALHFIHFPLRLIRDLVRSLK